MFWISGVADSFFARGSKLVIGAKVVGILLIAGWLSFPSAAEQNPGAGKAPASHWQSPSNAQKNPNNANRQGQKQQPNRKMGDWLTAHKDLPPAQQQKLLESDPKFKNLPPQRQAELRERLQKFNSLTPQQRERALQRMRYMATLTPEQRQQIRDANQQLQGLPQERQVMVHKALRHLRQMPPDERQKELQSDRFRGYFSEPEQKILNQLAVINPEGEPNQQPK
jgi:hypothetical protein